MKSTCFKPTKKDIMGVIEMLRLSNCLPRWSAHLPDGYTEIAKQALNCQIAVILFAIVKNEGTSVDFSLLPKIALSRAFEKYEKCDITEECYKEMLSVNPELENNFIQYISNSTISLTSKSFSTYISIPENCLEMKIYKAATAVATLIEAHEIENRISKNSYNEILSRHINRFAEFNDMPFIKDIINFIDNEDKLKENDLYRLFTKMSKLRNRIRWVKRAPIIDYSVLGHSYDVAVLNYLLSLSEFPGDEGRATQGFFVGLYHDLAEIWTGDIPSPIKDAVKGLRKATEEYELKVLERNVFTLIPGWFLDEFKGMMLEMLPEEEHKFYKYGDNLAAIIEASSQLRAGSANHYFLNVILSECTKKEDLKMYCLVKNQIRKDTKVSIIQVALYRLKKAFNKAKK